MLYKSLKQLMCISTFLFFIALPEVKSQAVEKKSSAEGWIGLSCGFTGQASLEVKRIAELLVTKQYTTLVELINTGTPAAQSLAVMACEVLVKQRELSLPPSVRDKIVFLYQSNQHVNVCSGCVLNSSLAIGKLLMQTSRLSFGRTLRNYFQNIYEKSTSKI